MIRYVCQIPFEHWKCIIECCHMISSGPDIILVCAFSWTSDDTLFLLFLSRVTWGSGTGLYAFIFQIYIFGNFSLLAVKCWLLISWKNYRFLLGSLVGVHLGMPLKYAPSGSALVTGFDYGVIFIWVPSCFTSWILFWPNSLTGSLWGTAGGFDFLNILARVFNAYLCPCPNFTKGLEGAGFCSA